MDAPNLLLVLVVRRRIAGRPRGRHILRPARGLLHPSSEAPGPRGGGGWVPDGQHAHGPEAGGHVLAGLRLGLEVRDVAAAAVCCQRHVENRRFRVGDMSACECDVAYLGYAGLGIRRRLKRVETYQALLSGKYQLDEIITMCKGIMTLLETQSDSQFRACYLISRWKECSGPDVKTPRRCETHILSTQLSSHRKGDGPPESLLNRIHRRPKSQ